MAKKPLAALVKAGFQQLQEGNFLPFDDEAVKRIRRAGRAKLAAKKKAPNRKTGKSG